MKCKYRVRWFSSKGALLVLLWGLLMVFSYSSIAYVMADSIARKVPVPLKWSFIVSCLLSTIVSAPLLG